MAAAGGPCHQEALESGCRNQSLSISPNLAWPSPATHRVITPVTLVTSAMATGGIVSLCHPEKTTYRYGHRLSTAIWVSCNYGYGLPIAMGFPQLLALPLPPWGFTR